jgi:hypothetical protein
MAGGISSQGHEAADVAGVGKHAEVAAQQVRRGARGPVAENSGQNFDTMT